MKVKLIMVIVFLAISKNFFSQIDTLVINYFENYPFTFREAGKLKGIEVEIIEEYVNWLKLRKNMNVYVKYNAFGKFEEFYNSVIDGNANLVGLGALVDDQERRRRVVFSPPYLENTALLITDGSVPTIKSRDPAEVATVLNGMKPVVVSKSNQVAYMNDVIKIYDQTQLEVPDLIVAFTDKENDVLQKICSDKTIFGFVDMITFWVYVRANPSKFLKIQKVFSERKEFMGFIMPKRNLHGKYLNEFFESGFGFTSTKTYQQILEKYLGFEIIESVEIK